MDSAQPRTQTRLQRIPAGKECIPNLCGPAKRVGADRGPRSSGPQRLESECGKWVPGFAPFAPLASLPRSLPILRCRRTPFELTFHGPQRRRTVSRPATQRHPTSHQFAAALLFSYHSIVTAPQERQTGGTGGQMADDAIGEPQACDSSRLQEPSQPQVPLSDSGEQEQQQGDASRPGVGGGRPAKRRRTVLNYALLAGGSVSDTDLDSWEPSSCRPGTGLGKVKQAGGGGVGKKLRCAAQLHGGGNSEARLAQPGAAT